MSKIDNPPTVVTDHGALTGLTDDDHTQYTLLAGRSGGQTLIGGTGTTDDLILRSTAGVGATGADIILQVGNNGATEAGRILNAGNWQITGGKVIHSSGDVLNFITPDDGSIGVHLSTKGSIRFSTGTPTEKVRIVQDGNILVGGFSLPGAGTFAILFLGGTAPSSLASNTAGLYANDVAGTVEMFAIGEDGVATQISPHPSDFLATLPVEATGPYAFPWAERSFNPYLGKKIQVDMAGLVKAVEQLTGKQFAFVTDLPPAERADWDTDQEAQRVRRQAEIDNANQRRVDLDAQIAAEPDADKKAELIKQRAAITLPASYVKKRPPKWMRDRGVTSAP